MPAEEDDPYLPFNLLFIQILDKGGKLVLERYASFMNRTRAFASGDVPIMGNLNKGTKMFR